MTLYDPEGQANPQDGYDPTVPARLTKVVKALDENRPAVERWFWKALFAFNCILASLTFWFGLFRSL